MRLRLPHLDDVGVVKPAQNRDLSQAALGIHMALISKTHYQIKRRGCWSAAVHLEYVDYALDDDGFGAAWRRRGQARAAHLAIRPFAYKLRDFVLSGHVPLHCTSALPAYDVPERTVRRRARSTLRAAFEGCIAFLAPCQARSQSPFALQNKCAGLWWQGAYKKNLVPSTPAIASGRPKRSRRRRCDRLRL